MDYSTQLLKQPELIGRNWLIVRFGGGLSGQSSFRLSPLLFPLLEKMKHFLLIHFTHYSLLFGFANLAYWANFDVTQLNIPSERTDPPWHRTKMSEGAST